MVSTMLFKMVKIKQFLVVSTMLVKIKQVFVVSTMVVKINQFLVVLWWLK